MANKAKRFGALFGAAAATLIGAFYLMSRAAEKNEYRLYPEHPENEGLGFDPLSSLLTAGTKAEPGSKEAEPLPPAGPDAPKAEPLPPAEPVRPKPLNETPKRPGMVLEDPAKVIARAKAEEAAERKPLGIVLEPAEVVEPEPLPEEILEPAAVEEPAPAKEPVEVEEPEPEPAPAPAPAKARTALIGTATVTDDPADGTIRTVADVMQIPAENLVVLKAAGNMPMVFEFLNPAIRTEINLKNVYFIAPDGSVTCPPEDERENVVAFGRTFLAEQEDLRKFLDGTL